MSDCPDKTDEAQPENLHWHGAEAHSHDFPGLGHVHTNSIPNLFAATAITWEPGRVPSPGIGGQKAWGWHPASSAPALWFDAETATLHLSEAGKKAMLEWLARWRLHHPRQPLLSEMTESVRGIITDG